MTVLLLVANAVVFIIECFALGYPAAVFAGQSFCLEC